MAADVMTDGYLRFVFGLAAVLILIVIAVWGAKRLGLGTTTGFRAKGRRLALLEVMPLDQKRKLVLVRHDETDHLLLLGGTHETLLASTPMPVPPVAAGVSTAVAPVLPQREGEDGRKPPFLTADREA